MSLLEGLMIPTQYLILNCESRNARFMRCCDASVMPYIVTYNPNLLLYAVAEKASDDIKKEYTNMSQVCVVVVRDMRLPVNAL